MARNLNSINGFNQSDRKVDVVGFNENNLSHQKQLNIIKSELASDSTLTRLIQRTKQFEWRLVFGRDDNRQPDPLENSLLDGLYERVQGKTITYPNPGNRYIKGEQLGVIGIYPNRHQLINPDKEVEKQQYLKEMTATAFHESSHAQRQTRSSPIAQNLLSEELQAFKREQLYRNRLEGNPVRPTLKDRVALFEKTILPLYYEDVIDGSYKIGKIPEFIRSGKHRQSYDLKEDEDKKQDQNNFGNIVFHVLKSGNRDLLAQQGYQARWDETKKQLEVSKKQQIIYRKVRSKIEFLEPNKKIVLTESDILNSYQILHQLSQKEQQQQRDSQSSDRKTDFAQYSAPNLTAPDPIITRIQKRLNLLERQKPVINQIATKLKQAIDTKQTHLIEQQGYQIDWREQLDRLILSRQGKQIINVRYSRGSWQPNYITSDHPGLSKADAKFFQQLDFSSPLQQQDVKNQIVSEKTSKFSEFMQATQTTTSIPVKPNKKSSLEL